MLDPKRVPLVALALSLCTALMLILRLSDSSADAPSLWGATTLEKGPFGHIPFEKVFIHIDLKGAPPRVAYFEWFFPFLRSLGVQGIFIEYEDMFPYEGALGKIPRDSHYSVQDIIMINKLADENGLELVPLLQSFGHMEFVLKHVDFYSLRENPQAENTICPSEQRSMELINEMIRQVHHLHPNSSSIHIGSDEAYHVAEDKRCERVLNSLGERPRSVEKLKIRHIASVARLARAAGFSRIFAWNDMFATSSIDDLLHEKLDSLITPIVWGYAVDVLKKDYFPDGLFSRLAKDLKGHVRGLVTTGWQRFHHRMPLCELLPISVPSLAMNIMYSKNVKRSSSEMNREVKLLLNCTIPTLTTSLSPIIFGNATYYPAKEIIFGECDFHDKRLYSLIMNDLRLLTWKVNRLALKPSARAELRANVRSLKGKDEFQLIRQLTIYYFPEDVREFISQNISPLESTLF